MQTTTPNAETLSPWWQHAVMLILKHNRYDPATRTLTFTAPEAMSCNRQLTMWRDYFAQPTNNRGLPTAYITDASELRQLTAFFAWTAWASVARRPGSAASYTNNFPYNPEARNTPTSETLLWSALSLMALLGGIAVVLFAFGKFNFLGWKSVGDHVHPQMLPGALSPSQRATLKYFVLVTVLFLAQAMLGGATAHYRADPGSFYGIDVSSILPSHLARTWHLQLAIFWVATAYVAGGFCWPMPLADTNRPGSSWAFISCLARWFWSSAGACWANSSGYISSWVAYSIGLVTRVGNISNWDASGRFSWRQDLSCGWSCCSAPWHPSDSTLKSGKLPRCFCMLRWPFRFFICQPCSLMAAATSP
jgi:nitric oxide reductase large subunit